MGILTTCKPRAEVLSGELRDAIFAADFGDVIAENSTAPEVYRNPAVFFRNTHPARDLTRIVSEVFKTLAKPDEPGTALRLSTGFGGGKTHTLLSLWHLAQHVSDGLLGVELLAAKGRPGKVSVAAIDGSKAGHPVFAQHGGVVVRSLAGELAYQFGGGPAVSALGEADDLRAQPTEKALEAFLPEGPVLILLDELVIYLSGLDEQGRKNTLNVVNKLVAIASRRPQMVVVITDPGDQPGYSMESAALARFTTSAKALDELLGRKATDFDPIGSESAKVIARRLFESIDTGAGQETANTYRQLYGRVAHDHPGLIPQGAATEEYARRMAESYPFHPRLLDTAKDRLGALTEFQRSRGVLRLFARIIQEVWKRGEDVELVTAGELDFASPRIRGDLLQRLNKDQFEAAVSADVVQHAGELDNGARGIHTRVASALMLESLPGTTNAGLTPDQLTLAVLRPDQAGPEPVEALDHLIGVCWHTYPMDGGAGYQFRVEPNVRKQIEERRNRVSLADAEDRAKTEAQHYYQGTGIKMRNWPHHASDVPDSPTFQVVLVDSEQLARSATANSDDRDPAAPIKRRFINAIVGVAPTEATWRGAVGRAQSLIAAEELEREYATGEAGKLIRDQLKKLKPELEKQFKVQTRRAFDRVVLADGSVYSIDESFQGGDDQLLKAPRGQEVLRRFLEEKELIFRPDDSLVPRLLIDRYLSGAVPVTGEKEVWSTEAVHERLLSAQGLSLVMDAELTRRSLLRAMRDAHLVVRLEGGDAYDKSGVVRGPGGARRRINGDHLTMLPIDAKTLVALPGAATVWLAEDSPAGGGGAGSPPGSGGVTPPPPPPPSGPVEVDDLTKAIALAASRNLEQLVLVARTPADARLLSTLAQPLGATQLVLSVSVSGTAKGGGTIGLSLEGLKPTHPLKPLDLAISVANSLEDGGEFDARLRLDFEPALPAAIVKLEALTGHPTIGVRCTFAAESGGEV